MAIGKQGIDYFPNDCSYEDNVELLIAEFGMTGLGILNRLWQKIYKSGYYCDWNDDVALMFSRKNNVGVNVVSEILKCCFRRGILDETVYKKHGILTSKGIQKRYFEAVSRRKNVDVKNEYLLVDTLKIPQNVNILKENAYIISENADISKQSKVKESKVNKSKEESIPQKRFVPPSLDELQEFILTNKLNVNAKSFIDFYNSNGWRVGRNPMKDWRATCRNWSRREKCKPVKQGRISEAPSYNLEQIKADARNNTEIKYD